MLEVKIEELIKVVKELTVAIGAVNSLKSNVQSEVKPAPAAKTVTPASKPVAPVATPKVEALVVSLDSILGDIEDSPVLKDFADYKAFAAAFNELAKASGLTKEVILSKLEACKTEIGFAPASSKGAYTDVEKELAGKLFAACEVAFNA
jgi:hypothetical protein